jgi:FkbM family methyltransferase
MTLTKAAKSIIHRLGYDIRRTGAQQQIYKRPIDFINSRAIDLVVDVGANTGQYGEYLRYAGFRGRIVSFEPTAAAYQELAAKAAIDGMWTAENMAIGDEDGTASINVSELSVFSSILSQTPAALAFDPNARNVGKEVVAVARLDGLQLPQSNAALLKIDTQGFEQQVLAGASRCLASFIGVQMELPIIHLYEGAWSFDEAVAYMRQAGFQISNLIPVNYDTTDTVSLVEVECIFRRR